jgi:DNA-binding response OmpR family regulator
MHQDCPMPELGRVLLVEDDDSVQRLLQTILRTHCTAIDVAADGERALELINGNAYDVVVLDIMLPKKNGFEVAEAINAMPTPPGLVVLSAIARYFRDRFPIRTVVLQKPFDINQLEEAIREVRPIAQR